MNADQIEACRRIGRDEVARNTVIGLAELDALCDMALKATRMQEGKCQVIQPYDRNDQRPNDFPLYEGDFVRIKEEYFTKEGHFKNAEWVRKRNPVEIIHLCRFSCQPCAVIVDSEGIPYAPVPCEFIEKLWRPMFKRGSTARLAKTPPIDKDSGWWSFRHILVEGARGKVVRPECLIAGDGSYLFEPDDQSCLDSKGKKLTLTHPSCFSFRESWLVP